MFALDDLCQNIRIFQLQIYFSLFSHILQIFFKNFSHCIIVLISHIVLLFIIKDQLTHTIVMTTTSSTGNNNNKNTAEVIFL